MSLHAAGSERLALGVTPRGGRAAVDSLARVSADSSGTVAVALVLCLVTFVASGGLSLQSAIPVEMGLTLAGGLVVGAVAIAAPPAQHFYGSWSVGLMLVLVVVTAASVAWSVSPDDSWQQASLMLAYAAVFAAAAAVVRVAPVRWSALLSGIILAGVIVCGYALLTRVFPERLNPTDAYSRLQEPYGYWNAIGLTAALAVAPCLWLGARREGHGALNALAVPAVGLCLVTLLLAYSRGALLALAIGLLVWFTAVPLRLRGAAVLLLGGAGAVIVVLWDFSQQTLTTDHELLVLQSSGGHQLGVMLAAMVLGLLVVGLALSFSISSRRIADQPRRRIATALLVALALLPVLLIGALTASHRGLTGSISHGVDSLTNVNARVPPNSPGRLTAVGSVRARYWNEALQVFQAHPLVGSGAGGYATARLRYANETLNVQHAHGYVVQTLSDLGLVGLAASLALLAAWLAAAARSTHPWGLTWVRRSRWSAAPQRRPQEPTAERAGLLTMLAVVVVFGAHSLVDWTWFVPGNACVALACAGWLAGHGPAPAATEVRGGAGTPVAGGTGQGRGAPAHFGRRRLPSLAEVGSVRIWAVATIAAVALVGAWAQWQPLRAVTADNAAAGALDRGNTASALALARSAVARDPLSINALFYLANVQVRAGNQAAARAACERAVQLQPANPSAWLALAGFNAPSNPQAALADLGPALSLDPQSAVAREEFVALLRRRATAAGAPASATPGCVAPSLNASAAPGG